MTKKKKLAIAINKGDINGRFAAIINTLYGGNKRAFANAINISPSVIENVTGTRLGKPSFDVLRAVVMHTDVMAHWLLTGEGSMLKESITQPDDASYSLGMEEARLQGRIEQLERDNSILRIENRDLCREIGGLQALLTPKGGKPANSHMRTFGHLPTKAQKTSK